MLPVEARRFPAYSPELESLRGVAILLVVLFHADWVVQGEALVHPSPLSAFLYGGHTGVSLFFVLSGFLLSTPFLAELEGERPSKRRRYYLRRVLRILPMYYAAWTVAVGLTARSLADVGHWVPLLAFVRYFTPEGSLLPYSATWWSLATEVQFYLVLPLLPFVLRSQRRVAVVAGIYLAFYAAFLLHLFRPSILVTLELSLSLFGRAPVFACGILAAFVNRRYGAAIARWTHGVGWFRHGGADAALLGVLVALAYLLRGVAIDGFFTCEAPPRVAWHVLEASLWAIALLLLLLAPLLTKALLSNPVLEKVGVISYSLFLIHYPFLVNATGALRRRFPGHFETWDAETTAAMAVLLLCCLAISTLTYRAIERPFLVRKARLPR